MSVFFSLKDEKVATLKFCHLILEILFVVFYYLMILTFSFMPNFFCSNLVINFPVNIIKVINFSF